MAFKLAEAFVAITTKDRGMMTGLSKAKGALTAGLAGIAKLAAGIGGVGLGASLGFAVKLASDAEEIGTKFEAVFKETTADAEKFANDFAGKIGRSINDTKEQMSGFQDVLVPLGFARDVATDLSKKLTKAAADLGSFNNKSDAEAANALTRALLGENDMLKSFSVVLSAADVKAELLARGQDKLTGQAMKQAKALATLELIMRNSTDAQGDAERTAGGFANRLKGLIGAAKDAGAAIGSVFLPTLAKMAKFATDAIRSVIPTIQAFAMQFNDWLNVINENWTLIWDIMKATLHAAVLSYRDIWLQMPKFWAFILGRVMTITADIWDKIASFIGKVVGIIVETARDLFSRMWENIKAMFTGADVADSLASGIETAMEKLRAAFMAGVSGDDLFGNVIVFNVDTKAAQQKARDLTQELIGLKDKFTTARKAADAERKAKLGRGGGTQAENLTVKKVEFPTGTFGAIELSNKLQDALLKSSNPQEKMVGLMEADKVNQKNMLKELKKVSANTAGAGTLAPVAAP